MFALHPPRWTKNFSARLKCWWNFLNVEFSLEREQCLFDALPAVLLDSNGTLWGKWKRSVFQTLFLSFFSFFCKCGNFVHLCKFVHIISQSRKIEGIFKYLKLVIIEEYFIFNSYRYQIDETIPRIVYHSRKYKSI